MSTAQFKRAKLVPFDIGGQEPQEGEAIPLDFNPETLTLKVSSGEQRDQGRRGRQQVQNVGASKATLSFECIFDSTRPRDLDGGTADAAGGGAGGGEEMLDVRTRTKPIADLLQVQGDGRDQAPRRVQFRWGTLLFNGIISSHQETFDYFSPSGVPLRSKVQLTLTEQEFRYEVSADDAARRRAAVDQANAGARALADAAGAASLLGGGLGAGFSAGFEAGLGLEVGLDLDLSAGFDLDIGLDVDLDLGLSADLGLSVKLGASADIGLSVGAGVDLDVDAAVDLFGAGAISATAGAGGPSGAGIGGGIGAAGGGQLRQRECLRGNRYRDRPGSGQGQARPSGTVADRWPRRGPAEPVGPGRPGPGQPGGRPGRGGRRAAGRRGSGGGRDDDRNRRPGAASDPRQPPADDAPSPRASSRTVWCAHGDRGRCADGARRRAPATVGGPAAEPRSVQAPSTGLRVPGLQRHPGRVQQHRHARSAVTERRHIIGRSDGRRGARLGASVQAPPPHGGRDAAQGRPGVAPQARCRRDRRDRADCPTSMRPSRRRARAIAARCAPVHPRGDRPCERRIPMPVHIDEVSTIIEPTTGQDTQPTRAASGEPEPFEVRIEELRPLVRALIAEELERRLRTRDDGR